VLVLIGNNDARLQMLDYVLVELFELNDGVLSADRQAAGFVRYVLPGYRKAGQWRKMMAPKHTGVSIRGRIDEERHCEAG
jgi:hypothetical protein